MAVYQLIYTSSKRGYGVFSKSSEIKPDESRQITINTAYKRPQALINSNETNYKNFPINLSRFRLSNQKWVIAQSAYVGLDNTGRQGNFFTHALLISNSKDFSKKYLYYAYRNELTDEEKELVTPPVLPQVGDFDISNHATLTFAKENSSKLALFVQSFLDAQRGRKKLAIEDKNENIILWIKFLYDVMPIKLLEEVEFTTYTDRITSAFDIVGIFDSSIVKDLSRFVNFDGKDNNVEISSFAKDIVDDYLKGQARELFYFFSNSMKREELLQNIDSLYTTLNTSNVSIDEVFSLIKNLPKNDLSISTEVINFLLNSDFLNRFDDSQIQYVLNLIEPSENTSEYNSIIHKIAFSCKKNTLDMLISVIKPNLKLLEDIDQKDKNDNINFLLLCLKLKSNISPYKNDRFFELFDAASLISGTKNEWLKAPFFQLIDQIIMTFPRNDGIHSESDLKSLLAKIKDFVSYEVIYERVANRFRNEMQQIEGINQLAIRNSTLLVALNAESKDIARMLRNFDSKENQPRLLQILETVYNTLSESAGEDSTLMSQYKALLPIYEQAFDHLSRGKQKKFIRRYRRVFGNNSQVQYRPNYLMFSLLGLLAISIIGGSGYLFINSRPRLVNVNDQTELSALLFAKVVNEDNEIFNFVNTPEKLVIELANVVMSDYELSNSGILIANYNSRRNRVEYNISDSNFLSPTFVVKFERMESQTPPVIVISGIGYSHGDKVSVSVNYDQLYSGDVYEILNDVLGTVQINDDTFSKYQLFTNMLGVTLFDDNFNNINNLEFHRFINLETKMFDEFDRRRTLPKSSSEEYELVVTNHAGIQTSVYIELNIDANIIQIKEEFPKLGDKLIDRSDAGFSRLLLARDFIISLNINMMDVKIDSIEYSAEAITIDAQSGILTFKIPIVEISSDIIPTIILEASSMNEIEIDWAERIENDYETLLEEIYSLIGNVLVSDDGFQLVLNEELYRKYLTSYLDKDFSLQPLSTFNHPFLDLVVSDQSEALASRTDDRTSFVIQLSVVNVFAESSELLEIIIKNPINVSNPE